MHFFPLWKQKAAASSAKRGTTLCFLNNTKSMRCANYAKWFCTNALMHNRKCALLFSVNFLAYRKVYPCMFQKKNQDFRICYLEMKSHMQLELMVKVFELFWIKIFLCYLLKKVRVCYWPSPFRFQKFTLLVEKGTNPFRPWLFLFCMPICICHYFFQGMFFRKVFDFK